VKWKLEIEMKLLEKNGIRIEIVIIFKMEITLVHWSLVPECPSVVGTQYAHNTISRYA